MNYKLNAMYFSPTGTTKSVISCLAEKIKERLYEKGAVNHIDFTPPAAREGLLTFGTDDIVIIGIPVYAGRVPNVLLKYLNSIKGSGTSAVPVVVYGNRDYDDALIELDDILESNGFNSIAAGAFIGEHAFSRTLAESRPDEKDISAISIFADIIVNKIMKQADSKRVVIPGYKPYRAYYMPKDRHGQPVDIRRVTPRTSSSCTDCKLCAEICPMGSIDFDDVHILKGICIKCGACIKKCPVQAKYFDDANYLQHKLELEKDFVMRREPEMFL